MPAVKVGDRSAYATGRPPGAQWPIGPGVAAEWSTADRTAAQSTARDRAATGASRHHTVARMRPAVASAERLLGDGPARLVCVNPNAGVGPLLSLRRQLTLDVLDANEIRYCTSTFVLVHRASARRSSCAGDAASTCKTKRAPRSARPSHGESAQGHQGTFRNSGGGRVGTWGSTSEKALACARP